MSLLWEKAFIPKPKALVIIHAILKTYGQSCFEDLRKRKALNKNVSFLLYSNTWLQMNERHFE
jgi:hypothetical protein